MRKGHHFDKISMHSIYTAIVLAAALTASDLRMRENYVITGIPKRSYITVGCNGVFITRTCYHGAIGTASSNQDRTRMCMRRRVMYEI